jgi:putative ABC transport system permease protein
VPTIDYWNFVDPGYFRTAGIHLVEGRLFNPGDGQGATPVAIVNQTMARAFWKNGSAIGHRVRADFRPHSLWRTIVGVVADVKNGGLDKPTGTELYFPYQQRSTLTSDISSFVPSAALLIRTKIDPRSLAGPARAQVTALDPTIPVANVATMDDLMARSVSRPRFLTLLMTLFSSLSLMLAALGIYGVISYAVAQRTSEIGIRMALGAQSGHVLRLVGKSGLRIALTGTAVGALGALALTRYMSGLLFGVSSVDVATFLAMAGILAAVTMLACYIPARRASKINPIVALRYD